MSVTVQREDIDAKAVDEARWDLLREVISTLKLAATRAQLLGVLARRAPADGSQFVQHVYFERCEHDDDPIRCLLCATKPIVEF